MRRGRRPEWATAATKATAAGDGACDDGGGDGGVGEDGDDDDIVSHCVDELVVREGTDHRERGHTVGDHVSGHGADVLPSDRVDVVQDLAHGHELAVHQFALAEAAHPGAGVLETEHE